MNAELENQWAGNGFGVVFNGNTIMCVQSLCTFIKVMMNYG